MKKSSLAVCVYDLHHPEVDEATWQCILDFLKHNKVDTFIWGGDALDFGTISHHNDKLPGNKRKGGLKADLDSFRNQRLMAVEKLLPKKCKRVFITGNHERFIDDLCSEKMPELEGMINVTEYLNLKSLGYKVIPLAGSYRLGELLIIHGDVISGGANPAKKALEVFKENVLLGHFHSPSSFSSSSPVDSTAKYAAWVSPCAGSTAPKYMRGRANSWINGFTVVETREDGMFNVYPIVVVKGRFSFGGIQYGH